MSKVLRLSLTWQARLAIALTALLLALWVADAALPMPGARGVCPGIIAPLRWALPWPRWPSPHKERRDSMHQATMGRREGPASSAGIRRTKVMMHHLQPSRHAVRRRRGCALGVGSLQGPKGRPR